MSNVSVIDQAQPRLSAGGKVAAIVPQTMEDAYRLAKAVVMAGMAPKGMDTPEKCMISIMRGLEVGLTPFQALDKIAVVNGRPTIWGDGAMALVRGSGLCEFIRETIEGEGDAAVATCRAKRKGELEPIVGVFSVSDAKKAGLWGKQGPWQQFPKRMLQMRARAFALRDGFADVLGGLYLREEIEENSPRRDESAQTVKQEPTNPKVPPGPPPQFTSGNALPPPAPPKPPKLPEAINRPMLISFDDLRAELQAAPDMDAINAAFDAWIIPREKQMSDDEMDEAQATLREVCDKFGDGE